MTTELDKPRTLQERVGDRIRDQIGDLMTDEDLKVLVDKAMHEAFFTRTQIEKRYYNDEQKYDDSFAVKHVKELLKGRVDAACATWLGEHKDELGKHIDEAVGKGFLALFQSWLDGKVQVDLMNFGNALRNSLGIR